jgi:hypothetical protein
MNSSKMCKDADADALGLRLTVRRPASATPASLDLVLRLTTAVAGLQASGRCDDTGSAMAGQIFPHCCSVLLISLLYGAVD